MTDEKGGKLHLGPVDAWTEREQEHKTARRSLEAENLELRELLKFYWKWAEDACCCHARAYERGLYSNVGEHDNQCEDARAKSFLEEK